jgi:hypothetical protein
MSTVQTTDIQIMHNGNPDGLAVLGNTAERFAIVGNPVVQRTNPMQSMSQAFPLGTIATYNANAGSPANAATISTNEIALTVAGLAATDFILGVNKPTAQAGMGICNIRANAANSVGVGYTNPTAANVVPTASETYVVTALRNGNPISANLVPVLVPLNSTNEQTFTLAGSGAAGTAILNGAGQVTGVNMSATGASPGSNYFFPPTINFVGGGGSGATGVAIVNSGQVVGVQMTNLGAGYTSAPTVMFIGGNNIAPGMVVAVNKPTLQAGLGIGNVRVAGNNQIAIQFFNNSAANITPTANESYSFVALNEVAALSPVTQVVATLANCTAAAANTSNQTSAAVTGVMATDVFVSVNPTALQSPLVFGGGYTAANAINFQYGGGVPGGTPAGGTYTFNLMRPTAPVPFNVSSVLLTPTSVAALTTAEQIFTLPANVTLTANATVVVNKPSFTSNISIVGARANSSTTLAITYQNNSANAITPPAEIYLVGSVNTVLPVLGANLTAGYASVPYSPTQNSALDLVNELQHELQIIGAIKGA